MRTNPVNTKARAGRGREGDPGDGAEIPRQPKGKTMEEQKSTLQPMDNPTPDQADIPYRNNGLCRAHAEAGSWQNCGHWRIHTGAVHPEGLQPMNKTYTGAGLERLRPILKAHAGTEERYEEETTAQRNCCVQTATPRITTVES